MTRPAGQRREHRTSPQQEDGFLALAFDVLRFFILLVPNIVLAFFRKLCPPKPKSLDGKVVLVTGAGQGLGRELALGFAREGCKVACVDPDQRSVTETAGDIVRDGEVARAYFANVANQGEVERLRESVTKDLGPVDILVNTNNLLYLQTLGDTTEEAARAVVGVNFFSHVWLTKSFLPTMKQRDTGHIVSVSSLAALYSLANASVYTASQSAVVGFMEGLRLEVLEENHDVHFTTVCTAFMRNPFTRAVLNSRQKARCRGTEEVAVRTLDAVKRNVVFLCVPEHAYCLSVVYRLLPTKMADWAHRLASGGAVTAPRQLLQQFDPIIRDTVQTK